MDIALRCSTVFWTQRRNTYHIWLIDVLYTLKFTWVADTSWGILTMCIAQKLLMQVSQHLWSLQNNYSNKLMWYTERHTVGSVLCTWKVTGDWISAHWPQKPPDALKIKRGHCKLLHSNIHSSILYTCNDLTHDLFYKFMIKKQYLPAKKLWIV